ncbi:hypothetical protein AX16_004612 [Volvariella volvacea WC 439]|nr:hypothetical protein AX16_004612 [Volvariella volvacea WC 439]
MSSGSKNRKNKTRMNEGNDIPSLAKYIKSGKCRNVMLMLGAVYTLAHELYPGKFRPTLTHSFIHLLHKHRLLHTCFTQNIDTLERRAGVPDHKIIEAHGSFATQHCIECDASYDGQKMKGVVKKQEIPYCPECGGLVKPDIVFFGESLPPQFIKSVSNVALADLLIVIGTSLTVHPFASLAYAPAQTCPRVLINLDPVGDFGSRRNDYILIGKCDEVVEQLVRELGWWEELMELWEATKDSVESFEDLLVEEGGGKDEEGEEKSEETQSEENERVKEGIEKLDAQTEVERLAAALEKQLDLSKGPPRSDSETPQAANSSKAEPRTSETANSAPSQSQGEEKAVPMGEAGSESGKL